MAIKTIIKTITAPLLIFLLSHLFASIATANADKPLAKNGRLDLRQQTFTHEHDAIALAGEWQFIWQQFVNPQPYPQPTQLPHRIMLPGIWADASINAKPLAANGYASYALELLLPNTEKPLGLKVPDFYSAGTVWINGELALRAGIPGRTRAQEKASNKHFLLELPAHTTRIHLLLHVSSFHHMDGGVKYPLIIGDYAAMKQQAHRQQLTAVFTVGAAGLLSVYFLMVYLGHRRDPAHLYVAVALIGFALRVFGTSGFILSVAPDFSALWLYRIEYYGFMFPMGFYLLFLRELFPQDFSKTVCQLFLVLALVGTGLVTVTEVEWFSQLRDIYTALFIPIAGFLVYGIVSAIRHHRQGALVVGFTNMVLAIAILNDSLIRLDFYQGLLFENWLYLFVTLSMAIALVMKFNRNMDAEAQLTRELRLINEELTDRVNARTQDLENKMDELSLSHQAALEARSDAERANQKKDEFLALMTHEVRTPLAGIQGSLTLLQDETLSAAGQQLLANAKNSAESLLFIVNDALDIARIEADKFELRPEAFSLPSLLLELQGLMEASIQGQGPQLNLTIDDDQWLNDQDLLLYGDSQSLRQILLNLISNAIKFTPEGTVTLQVKNIAHTDTRLRLKFSVIDNGQGISDADQETIFEGFTQLNTEDNGNPKTGSGLGLHITRQLVEVMGGQIRVESKIGTGSRFFFELEFPIVQGSNNTDLSVKTKSHSTQPLQPLQPLQRLSILVAEDDTTNRDIARLLLEQAGHKVHIAVDGLSAVERATRIDVDAVLMDIQLPGISGLTAIERIRKIKPSLPIFAVTANVREQDLNRYTAAGVDAVIAKPINAQILHQQLAQLDNNDASTEIPLLDSNNLEVLIDSLGRTTVAEKLRHYQADRCKQFQALDTHWQARNLTAIVEESHRLSGSCSYQGMHRLAQLLKKIEQLAQTNNDQGLAECFEQLPSLIKATDRQLAPWLVTQRSN